MKSKIYEGVADKFTTEDFQKLMEEFDADKIVETDKNQEYDFNDWHEKTNVYFDHVNNLAIVHSQEGMYSRIILYGAPKKIGTVKKKILEAIASIPFDSEGFR